MIIPLLLTYWDTDKIKKVQYVLFLRLREVDRTSA